MASNTPSPVSSNTDVFPNVAQFVDALSTEPHWYNLGIFLHVPSHELNRIGLQYRSEGTSRCLIEVYNSLVSLNKVPSWEFLSQVLKTINNVALANEIYTNYVLKPQAPSTGKGPASVSENKDPIEIPCVDVPKQITREFEQLSEKFSQLAADIISAIKHSNIDIGYLQQLLIHEYNITPLPPNDATIDKIFSQLFPKYNLLNYGILKFLTEVFLKEHKSLKRGLSEHRSRVSAFRNSSKMRKLVQNFKIIQEKQSMSSSRCKIIKLNVREFWNDVTLEQFEAVMKSTLHVYRYGTQIQVVDGGGATSNNLIHIADVPTEDVGFQDDSVTTKVNIRENAEDSSLKNKVELPIIKEQTDTIDDIGNEGVANAVKTHIEEEGVLKLRIVKALLLGGPGVGKTTTLLRLLGKIINLAKSSNTSPSLSTGVDTAKALHLHHDLYKDCTKMSVMIEKDWKGLRIEEQAGVLVNCVSNSASQEETSKPSSDSSQHLNVEEDMKHPSSNEKDGNVTPPIKRKNSNPHTVSQKFKEIEDLIAESNWKEVEKRLQDMAETTILHIIDTGGQPEFFEILPLILRGPSLCLLFLSLVQPLMEYFDVTFRSKETPLTKYTSSCTPIQMIQQVLASLKSLNDSEQESAACLIATHLDEVSDRADKAGKINEFEDQIKMSLSDASFYKKDLLSHFTKRHESGEPENHSKFFPLDNKNGTEHEINLLRTELTRIIGDKFTPEPIKTSWGFFHLVLLHCHEHIGFCSLQEATSLAKRCGIHTDNDVTKALKFFHNRFGTILYFGDVPALKDLVFCNLNLVFHPITKLVAVSFGANLQNIETAKEIRKTGEIEKEFFESICKKDDETKPVNSEMIVALLKHVHIITELPNGNLFMSCLLHPFHLDELKKLDKLSEMNPAPLLFTFDSGYQPVGLFHALMASLLLKYKDRFTLYEERYRNKIDVLYNEAFFTILSNASMLEIQISKADKAKCLEVKKLLWDQVHDIIKEMPHMKNIKVCLGFYCPKSFTASHPSAKIPSLESDKNPLGKSPQTESPLHIAIMLPGQSGTDPTQVNFRCKKKCDNLHPMTLEDKHKIWFEHFHSDIKSVGVQVPVTIDPDSITSLVSTINDVFSNNIARLHSLLEGSIDDFTREMVQEQLIVRAVSLNPTYTTVINNFLAKLAFMTEKRKIEQHCGKFLKVLHNIGEQDASESMKKQLVDAVKGRLNIDMNLDNYIIIRS